MIKKKHEDGEEEREKETALDLINYLITSMYILGERLSRKIIIKKERKREQIGFNGLS